MAGETTITVVGNLTADPELKFTQNGKAVANFTVASTPRAFNKQAQEFTDGETMFLRCSVWRDMAENVAETLAKGMPVIVQGNLKSRSWDDKEGNKRTNFEVDVVEVGPSLRFATAVVTKVNRRQQAPQQSQQGGWGQQPTQQWGGQQGGFPDDPGF